MKTFVYIVSIPVFLASIASTEARNDVEGFWSNQRYNLEIQIEQTREGIRVQRTDRSRWRSYQKIRNSQFRDREGNTYFLISDNELEWESRDGGKRIRFHRDSQSNGRYDRGRHRKPVSTRRAVSARDLQGTWIDLWDDDCLVIRSRRGDLRVRGIGWGARTFYLTRSGFRDHKGNLLRLQGRKLQLINRRGRLVGQYVR